MTGVVSSASIQQEGRRRVRLPTEAESGARGTTTPWSFGDWQDVPRVAGRKYAYWSEAAGKHDRRLVGYGRPNAFGLYDMHGNVWEYVADWWHRDVLQGVPHQRSDRVRKFVA